MSAHILPYDGRFYGEYLSHKDGCEKCGKALSEKGGADLLGQLCGEGRRLLEAHWQRSKGVRPGWTVTEA